MEILGQGNQHTAVLVLQAIPSLQKQPKEKHTSGVLSSDGFGFRGGYSGTATAMRNPCTELEVPSAMEGLKVRVGAITITTSSTAWS